MVIVVSKPRPYPLKVKGGVVLTAPPSTGHVLSYHTRVFTLYTCLVPASSLSSHPSCALQLGKLIKLYRPATGLLLLKTKGAANCVTFLGVFFCTPSVGRSAFVCLSSVCCLLFFLTAQRS